MERINISTADLADFLSFTEQAGISLVSTKETKAGYELTYNTNQIFVLSRYLYDKVQIGKFPFLVDDYKMFDKLDLWMKDQIELGVDTETDGLTRFRQCLGVSFSDGNQHFYIPLKKWNGEKLVDYWLPYVQKRVESYLRAWLRDTKKKWIGHNIVFDVITLENALGINILDNIFSDTALLHHTCVSEDPPHGLKVLAALYVDPAAGDAQQDLADNVVANGGVWKKDRKDFFVADVPVLAKYAALDPFYTMKLHKMWYPEIEKQGLQKLWFEEVLPLTKVIYQLNTTGMDIDLPYFKGLAAEVPAAIDKLEEEILSSVQDKIADYEFQYVLKKTKITDRSELGKLLRDSGLTVETGKELILEWYKQKHQVKRVFNFASKDHLGYLIYDVLDLPILKTTKTGQASTSKAALDELLGLDDMESDSPTINKIKLRSKEIKILNTYILPILENQVNGRIYPQFNQIGTSSGRFTSGEPINFQTLPRDDMRIKKGFIAGKDQVIVNADFSSLEPRCFAHMSEEPEIKRVYKEGLDLYSHVHKVVMKDDAVSSREGDANFLKLVNPKARQESKTYTLGFAYCMTEYKYAATMGVTPEEGLEVKNKYFRAFPRLKKYQDKCISEIHTKFSVSNLMGRKRRAKLIPLIRGLYPKVDTHDRRHMSQVFEHIQDNKQYQMIAERLRDKGKPIRNSKDLYYAVRNEYNNSTNFPIQGLGASIANAAAIEFCESVKKENLEAKLALNVHDELTAISSQKDSKRTAELLKKAMENNKVARMISVEMQAKPIIAHNLAEAK